MPDLLGPLRVGLARVAGWMDRRGGADDEFSDELEAHLALAEEDLVARGLSPVEARRRARLELGGVTQLMESARAARGLPWLDSFWLDLKLGARKLRSSWGLSLVGGFAMTVAIGIGVAGFWMLETLFFSTLPLEDAERIVALQVWDEREGRRASMTFEDLETWRAELQKASDIGAFRSVQRNLIVGEDEVLPVEVAEMTASGFDLARVAPLLGRPLVREDELPGAPPVVVLGHDAWNRRFAADPSAVGSTLRFGETEHLVVGVMPPLFGFPVNHQYWTPLRPSARANERFGDGGPEGLAFARLAPGATGEMLQGEIEALGLSPRPLFEGRATSRMEDGAPVLRPRVVPYTFAFTGDFEPGQAPWLLRTAALLFVLLLVPPCANLAILFYARIITRQQEFAARSALGARRSRIVLQLFLEVLVLAALAAAAALVALRVGIVFLREVMLRHADELPFWFEFGLSLRTVLFAALLATLAAGLSGLIPAIKATGGGLQARFQGAGGKTTVRLGVTWTALVVAQVAVTVACLPSALELGWGTLRQGVLGPGFDAGQFMTAVVDVPEAPRSALASEVDESRRETANRLVQALQVEQGVARVAVSTAVAGDEPWVVLSTKADAAAPGTESGEPLVRRLARLNSIDGEYFALFDHPLLLGRGLDQGSAPSLGEEPSRRSFTEVVLSRTLAEQLFGSGDALGRRLRVERRLGEEGSLTAESNSPWLEVVGIVPDLPAHESHGTLYRPLAAGGALRSFTLTLPTDGDPVNLANVLRQTSLQLDANLRVRDVQTLGEVYLQQQVGNNLGATALLVVTVCVLLLSIAGLYALMSFTVRQRRREIGIRAALGARPARLLFAVFRPALLRVATGALLGSLVAWFFQQRIPAEQVGGWEIPGVVAVTALFMALIAVAAASGPARRGLAVDPATELADS